MKKEDEFVTEKHLKTRGIFRVLGPISLGVGIILIIISIVDFFGGMNNFGEPDKFWMFFLAMPFILVGAALTNMGYGSVVARYEAREYSPVAKDTINYIAKESAPGVKEISKAFRDDAVDVTSCPKCQGENIVGAKYCNHCGDQLSKSCTHCGKENTANAKFCNDCGRTI